MTTFFGDWLQTHAWLNGLEKAPLEPFSEQVEVLGKAIQKKVQQHIVKQDLDWVPLAHSTIRQKGFESILMNSLEYLQKIDFEVLKNSSSKWELIVYPKGDHAGSGLSMQTLAMYLEYGTSRMPERPLWRVVFEEIEGMDEFKAFAAVDSLFG